MLPPEPGRGGPVGPGGLRLAARAKRLRDRRHFPGRDRFGSGLYGPVSPDSRAGPARLFDLLPRGHERQLVFHLEGGDRAARRGDAMSARPSGASPANLPHLADPGPVVLEARGVCKYFQEKTAAPVRALDDVSLVIARGEFCALTGPSGSGKTTLLALLGALDRASRGQVLFHGRDLGSCSDAELARLRRRTGFIFQDLALIPTLP